MSKSEKKAKKDKKGATSETKAKQPPNLLLILTDQQRQPRHWPEEAGWLEELVPTDAELSRTGVTFTEACAASCMCSPSRASLFTGKYPAEHGVDLTLTRGGFKPDIKNGPATVRKVVESSRRGEISPRSAMSTVLRNAVRRPNGGKGEKNLDPKTPNLARILARAGYRTVLKGKWHLSQPAGGEWAPEDGDRLEELYGFEGWVPPDAGENTEPSSFGGGNQSGTSEEGFDEDFARQAEEFLSDPPRTVGADRLPGQPHDVLAFPSTFEQGGYRPREWVDLDQIELPPSVDENLASKPHVHKMMKVGQSSYLGVLDDDQRLDYCRFYAHLHRLVDGKVKRVVDALGDPGDPESLRSKTLIIKTSDHGELGMSHGGQRQKAFNAYDETINVPLIVSNPVMFPEAKTSAAPVSLVDILPTMAAFAGVDTSGDGIRGKDLTPVLDGTSESVRDEILFTYDDHQAGSAFTDVAPPPNHIRAVRSAESMYAVYFDPDDRERPQYELYDMTRDPDQVDNLVDKDTGRVLDPQNAGLLLRKHAALVKECRNARAYLPA
ncbi:MAG: sulfatase-like hydrolase/transferase [Solirubrobacterales bacterium]|nr:sulfatase-like hydrolase/transferase [Solirubrobacterales bacterium]